MRRVVCIQRRLTHYRMPLFDLMRTRLAQMGIAFELVVGDPMPAEEAKQDEGKLAWATHVPCRYFMNGKLCWQDNRRAVAGADLVIVTQENKLLYNYLALTICRPKRVAFWGHGRNFQTKVNDGWRERFKRMVSMHVDWWFAYTGLSQRLVAEMGYSQERITNLENSIDSRAFSALCASVTAQEIAEFRAEWNIGEGPMTVFVGSLYEEKRIDFLIEAGKRLATVVPGFRLVVVGAGPQRAMVETVAERESWLLYVGARFGKQKAICLRSAVLMLNPGLVGLGILDSFVAGLPMVTTDCNLHSPEIDYLRNGKNGVMTEDSMDAYVLACTNLLVDSAQRKRLSAAALAEGEHYTVENMAARFCDGIAAALGRLVR